MSIQISSKLETEINRIKHLVTTDEDNQGNWQLYCTIQEPSYSKFRHLIMFSISPKKDMQEFSEFLKDVVQVDESTPKGGGGVYRIYLEKKE